MGTDWTETPSNIIAEYMMLQRRYEPMFQLIAKTLKNTPYLEREGDDPLVLEYLKPHQIPKFINLKFKEKPKKLTRVNWYSLVERHDVLAYDVEGSVEGESVVLTLLAGVEFSTVYVSGPKH